MASKPIDLEAERQRRTEPDPPGERAVWSSERGEMYVVVWAGPPPTIDVHADISEDVESARWLRQSLIEGLAVVERLKAQRR